MHDFDSDRLGFLHKKLGKLRKKTLHGKIRGAVTGGIRGKRRRGSSQMAVAPAPTLPGQGAEVFYEAPPAGYGWSVDRGQLRLMPLDAAPPILSLPVSPIATPELAPPLYPQYPASTQATIGPPLPAPSSMPWQPSSRDLPYSDSQFWEGDDPGYSHDPLNEMPGGAAAQTRELDEMEADGDFSSPWGHRLAGFGDDLAAYYRQAWDRAVASLQSKIAAFRALRGELLVARAFSEKALDIAARNPQIAESSRLRLRELGGRVGRHLEDHAALEKKVAAASEKIGLAQAETASHSIGVLPLIPIAIGAASVAAIVAVAGAVVLHTQRVKATAQELDQVARGILTAEQIARIKGAGVFGGMGSALSMLPALAIGGGLLYVLLQMRRRPA